MWAGRGFLRLRKYTVAASFYPHVHVVDVGTPARRLDEVRLEMSFGERGEEAAVPSFFSQFNFASFP